MTRDEMKQLLEPSTPEPAPGSNIATSPAQMSIAISLRRIADAINSPNAYGEVGSAAIAGAILRGLRGG